MKSEIYFTSGDFAKLCEVTKQTLLHYDKIGLLHPDHKDEKGYRYYSYVQLDIMYVIESLKEMEMPLREIKEFISVTTPETMIRMFTEKSKQISEKINTLKSIQNKIEIKIAVTKEAETTDFSEIVLTEAEEEYLYLSAPLLNYDDDENRAAISDFYKICMRELHENYSIGAMVDIESLRREKMHSYKYLFVRTSYTDALPLVKKELTQQTVAYHVGKYEDINHTYAEIFEFLTKNRLSITDYAYEEPILDRISVNDSEKYVTKITVPVTALDC